MGFRKTRGVRSRYGRLTAVLLAVLLLGGLAAPSALRAADEYDEAYDEEADGPLKECLDKATLDYNDCLMQAGTKFERWICDLVWQAEYAVCWSQVIGEIKKNVMGDEEAN